MAPLTDRPWRAGAPLGDHPPRADLHQHVWTRPLIEALAARRTPPFVRRDGGQTLLYAAGEPPYLIDEASEAPVRRAELLRTDGLDTAVVAPSSPIGIESLRRAEARELIAAHLEGVSALAPEFLRWGPVALDRPDPADVDELLRAGCVGVSLPAGALAGRASLDAAGALLERAAERGAPVFVHPGAAPTEEAGRRAPEAPPWGLEGPPWGLQEPSWWLALTDYVAQMQAAWLAFAAFGRPAHPTLTVIFALLAGGAPLLTERLVARGGPRIELEDPHTFYETSSYDSTAIETIARITGAEQLVYGSDRPMAQPSTTGHERRLQENGGWLLVLAARTVALEGAI